MRSMHISRIGTTVVAVAMAMTACSGSTESATATTVLPTATVTPPADTENEPSEALARVATDLDEAGEAAQALIDAELPYGLLIEVVVEVDGLVLMTSDVERTQPIAERVEAELGVEIVDIELDATLADAAGAPLVDDDLITPGY